MNRPALSVPAIAILMVAFVSCGDDGRMPTEVAVEAAKGGKGKPGGGDGGSAATVPATALDLPGANSSSADDVNDAGTVTGNAAQGEVSGFALSLPGTFATVSFGASGYHSISGAGVLLDYREFARPTGSGVWGPEEPLPVPDGWLPEPFGKDIAGDYMTGYSEAPNGEDRVLRWMLAGDGSVEVVVMPELPASLGATDVFANGVNRLGHVVGWVRIGSFERGAFVWGGPGNPPEILPNLPGSQVSVAKAINDVGVIVGTAEADGNNQVAVVWRPDGSGGYSSPEQLSLPFRESNAVAINNAGQVAGDLVKKGRAQRGFVYDLVDATLMVLEPLSGFDEAYVGGLLDLGGINCSGQVVGTSRTIGKGFGPGERAASLWEVNEPGVVRC